MGGIKHIFGGGGKKKDEKELTLLSKEHFELQGATELKGGKKEEREMIPIKH